MTNKMDRDSDGLFINKKENKTETETTYEAPRFRHSPMELWESYTANSAYGDELFESVVADSKRVSLAEVGGSIPLISAMKLQHEATMAGVREARLANMIAIATHKEYFNKGTVATAYGEINDYVNGRREVDNSVLEDFIRKLPFLDK